MHITNSNETGLPVSNSNAGKNQPEIPFDAHNPIEGSWADALGSDVENPPTARTHGRQLFEPNGKTHTVATCENRIKGQMELWVQNNALEAIARIETRGDPERADRAWSVYLGDEAAGHYFWDGKHVRQARFGSVPGLCHLLYLLMARCDPNKTEEEVTELVRKYPKQCGELLRWALGNEETPAGQANAGGSTTNGATTNTATQQTAATPRQRVKPLTLD